MEIKDWVSIYGAATGTLAIILNAAQWWMRRRSSVRVTFRQTIERDAASKGLELRFAIRVVNHSEHAVRIDTVLLMLVEPDGNAKDEALVSVDVDIRPRDAALIRLAVEGIPETGEVGPHAGKAQRACAVRSSTGEVFHAKNKVPAVHSAKKAALHGPRVWVI